MAQGNRWNKVSASPTRTAATALGEELTAEDLFTEAPAVTDTALDEKLRQAYFWLVNRAVISPFYDVEFSTGIARHLHARRCRCRTAPAHRPVLLLERAAAAAHLRGGRQVPARGRAGPR
jgi:hypothetical protein